MVQAQEGARGDKVRLASDKPRPDELTMDKVVFSIPYDEALIRKLQQIENMILDAAGGFTANTVTGAWKGAKEHVYHEVSLQYTVLTDDLERLLQCVQRIAKLTQQEILYSEINGAPTFIQPEGEPSVPEIALLRTKVRELEAVRDGLLEELRASRKEKAMEVEPIWQGRNIPIDEKLCFVLLPLEDPFNLIFQDHIRPTVERMGFRCIKADDIYGVDPVMEDIWRQICGARVVVAELTGRNPNVFYETGIAHTIGKQVILVAQTLDDVPFDLRHLRFIIYEYTPRGCSQLEEALDRTVRAIVPGIP